MNMELLEFTHKDPKQVNYWNKVCTCKSSSSRSGVEILGRAIWSLDHEAPSCSNCSREWKLVRVVATGV